MRSIQNILDEMVKTGVSAGGNCLVYRDGSEICYCEAGYADLEKGVPIRRDTIFRLYSMSKPMTAAAVMALIEDGRLDLLDPVSKWIPAFSGQSVGEKGMLRPAKREVRIQDLLNMTSGCTYEGDSTPTQILTGLLLEEIKARMEGPNPLTTMEIAERLGNIPLSFDPGTEFLYGMSADILGAVIEAVSGKPFGTFLKERLLDPMGMVDTGFFVPEEKQTRLAQTYSRRSGKLALYLHPHLGISCSMKTCPAFESGGAGMVSTIDDWLKFCRMLLELGTLDGRQILAKRTVKFLTGAALTRRQRRGLADWENLRGYSYGNLMRVMIDPAKAPTLGSPGEYGWDGWLGPYMSVAPRDNLILLFMEQLTDTGTSSEVRRIRNIVYSSLPD